MVDIKMTYRQLKAHIETMDDAQLDSNVTIHNTCEDEYFPVVDIQYSDDENDVLDKNHPFLEVWR
jgi:hypothetical protein